MKAKSFLAPLSAIILLCAACSKPKSSPSPTNQTAGTHLFRIQQGIDPDITNDTVYLVRYDSGGRIAAVYDSLNVDSIAADYDQDNNLADWNEANAGVSTNFTYNGGALTAIDQMLAGSHEQYIFTYTNGTLSRIDYNTDAGMGGSPQLWNYFVITMSGGNITEEKVFNKNGVQVGDVTLTYSTQPNSLQKLALFNVSNWLGGDPLFNQNTYFNKNLLVGVSEAGTSMANAYTFTKSNLPAHVVCNDLYDGAIYNWSFYYK